MDEILAYAQAHPVAAAVVAVLGAGGLRWLLNRKSAAMRDAERRIHQLEDANRDRYREQRPLK